MMKNTREKIGPFNHRGITYWKYPNGVYDCHKIDRAPVTWVKAIMIAAIDQYLDVPQSREGHCPHCGGEL